MVESMTESITESIAEPLLKLHQQRLIYGQRQLIVLSGQSEWIERQLNEITSALNGDWITLSPHLAGATLPSKATVLLGREFLHGIFDAQSGCYAESLAILVGTLKAGSVLILCIPEWDAWPLQPDSDSLRWNEAHGLIATPHFVAHLQQSLCNDPDVLIWRENQPYILPTLTPAVPWCAPQGQATPQQQQILSTLLAAERGTWGIIAARGRGKSALAGMLIEQWPGSCWCCAPAKITTSVMNQFTHKAPRFWSVDSLLAYCLAGGEIEADWLIIDEAAAIPGAQLKQLTAYFPRCLLITTVEGYEGTGRGFLLKLCASLTDFQALTLTAPIRWAPNDPLERWLNKALLLDEKQPDCRTIDVPDQIQSITQRQFIDSPPLLEGFYGLLTSAHYRTSPLDLRRLLDAQNMFFMVSKRQQQIIGALWAVDEGNLSSMLSWQIWAGLRRPRGNLVAQSLAAHSYFPLASQLRSRRVSRIAVDILYRRQGIGLTLLNQLAKQSACQQLDYLSVSFGFTPELYHFWRRAGYRLVRLGSHKEASSGCFVAMMIFPLSASARQCFQRAEYMLQRDVYWRKDRQQLGLITGNDQNVNEQSEYEKSEYKQSEYDQRLIDEDWQELAGFAYTHRSLAASYFAICRFLATTNGELPILRLYCEQHLSLPVICQQLKIAGQKQGLTQARAELAAALEQQQPQRMNYWRELITTFYR